MAHVVMQAAQFSTAEAAMRAERELQALVDAYVEFEASDPDPWNRERVPPPLVAFGERHGVSWPLDQGSRFLVKGMFEDGVELLRVDRMLFFSCGGFDLGGETLRGILRKLGATHAREECHLLIESADPDQRVAELAAFLDDEDFEAQYSLDPDEIDWALHSLTVVSPDVSRTMSFDDSGVQDWAFVAILPQLSGEDPIFRD